MKISQSILKLHKINLPPLPIRRQSLLKDKIIKKAKMNIINFKKHSPKKINNKSVEIKTTLPEIKKKVENEKPKFLFPIEENNLNFFEPKDYFQSMENNLSKITKKISIINENELFDTKKRSNYAKYLQSQNHFEKLQEKKNVKINLSEKVKLMQPRINDLQLFLKEIEQKHKNLFKLIPKLLKNYKKVFNFKIKNDISIPPKLYDDFEYFINLYSSEKNELKKSFIKQFKKYDKKQLFLILLDYINYINIIRYQFQFFNNENLAIDVFNFDKDYYENVFTNIKSNIKPKIVSFGNIKTNEKTLESKFQKFLNKQSKKNRIFNNNESLISNNNNNISKEENFLNSYIKNLKNNNEKSILNTLTSKFSETKLSEKNSSNFYKFYGIKKIKNKNYFNSKIKKTKSFSNIKDTQLLYKKKFDTKNENEDDFYKNYSSSSSSSSLLDDFDYSDFKSNGSSYLDKNFIFEDKNSRNKRNKKFEVEIHKKPIAKVFKKDERSLYDNIIINKLKRNIINSAYN